MQAEVASEAIAQLLAEREILRAVHCYIRGQDRLDPALQRQAFHDDAYVDCGVFAGSPDDYVQFAQSALARYESSHHLLGQVSIEVDGEVAYGEVYFIAWHRLGVGSQAMDVIIAGRYVDEYRRRDGVWKISKRRELMDWGRKAPAADEFFRSNTKFHFGRRDGGDFSVGRAWPVNEGQGRVR